MFGHGLKLVYFGALIEQVGPVEPWFLAIAVASSMIGTSAGKLLLEKLTDKQFRTWSNRLITVLATYYVGYGLVLLTGWLTSQLRGRNAKVARVHSSRLS